MNADVFWLWEFLGRLHPLLVHFPIGLIVVAGFLELLAVKQRKSGLRDGIRALLWIGAISAVVSAGAGWLLAETGGYAGETLDYHKWTAIATAVLGLIVVWLHRRADQSSLPGAWKPYRIVLALCLIVLTVAGHLGASLTHGSDYLTSVLPWNEPDGETGALLAEFTSVNADDYQTAQLDRLNLEVRALFAHACYKCHSTEKQEGDLILDTKEGVFAGGENGVIFTPGDARNSEIIRRVSLPRGHDDAMPEKGKGLSRDEIDLIKRWINLGAHWADADLKIFPEAELALVKPELPKQSAFTHPVDKLVDVYFDAQGQRWPEAVEDPIFVRRAYLDITGLLPTADEVTRFVQSNAPNKREQLIRALLDQDHAYTQHWLTFWNDLLRNDYSGPGYITGGRKQITDWLYEALMQNASYDAMVRDLLNPTPASEGFIKGIQWRGETNNSQRVEMQAAQNISQSLLGVNLKCASCHNSFVSNLTLDQAYGFANVFADSTLEIFRCDKPTGRTAEVAFIYPELGTIDTDAPVEERLVQLADVVIQPANGRLYRTIVNRFWDRLVGRGIVMPVDEMDNPPWSPTLLDWLASDFIEHETDLKHLITRIMTSRAYQLPSVPTPEARDLVASDYAFAGPARRRLGAEQFADAMSQILGPVYHGVAYDPLGEQNEAEWIWHREIEVDRDVLPKPGKRYFRHAFNVRNASIDKAEALISVDHAFALHLNGSSIKQGSDWRQVHRLDWTDQLASGKNLIAIEGENDGALPNPAGILFSLKITYTDGVEEKVVSNTAWKTTREVPSSGWTQISFDDADWQQSRRFGRFSRSYWGQLLAFHHDEDQPKLPFARASLVTLDPFLKALGRPTRENVTTRRDDQATLLQALELTNGTFYNQALQEGAERWVERYSDDAAALVQDLYQSALGREPTRKEAQTAAALLGENPSVDSTQDLLWAIFMLPEFQLIY